MARSRARSCIISPSTKLRKSFSNPPHGCRSAQETIECWANEGPLCTSTEIQSASYLILELSQTKPSRGLAWRLRDFTGSYQTPTSPQKPVEPYLLKTVTLPIRQCFSMLGSHSMDSIPPVYVQSFQSSLLSSPRARWLLLATCLAFTNVSTNCPCRQSSAAIWLPP